MTKDLDPADYLDLPFTQIDADEIIWHRNWDGSDEHTERRKPFFLHLSLPGSWDDQRRKLLKWSLHRKMNRTMQQEGIEIGPINSFIIMSFAVNERLDEMDLSTTCYVGIKWWARSDTTIYGSDKEDPAVTGLRDHLIAVANGLLGGDEE